MIKVQKRKKISSEEVKHLKQKKLIEGIKPNCFISAKVAQKTGQKAVYTKARGFDKHKYLELIINCIHQHKYAERKDIDELLWNVLPAWMTDKQKKTKINHLLTGLSTKKIIKNTGTRNESNWVLCERDEGS